MNLFDFVTKNQSQLEQLTLDGGDIEIPIDQYDFSHQAITVMCIDSELVFELVIGQFTLTTRVEASGFKDASQHLKNISSPKLRREVIEAIEDRFRGDAEAEMEIAIETLSEATAEVAVAQKAYDNIVDALHEIKGAWSVP